MMRNWRLLVAMAMVLVVGGVAGMAAEEDEELSIWDVSSRCDVFTLLALDGLWREQTVYPASVKDNLAHAAELSTKDYLLVSTDTETRTLKKPETQYRRGICWGIGYYWDRWQVVDIAPVNYGHVVAELDVLAFRDSRQMIAGYCEFWDSTNMGLFQYLERVKTNDALLIGDLALCESEFCICCWNPLRIYIDFFRNGVVVVAHGKDSGNFHYLPFLRELDALLRRDGAAPAPAMGGLSEAEYQKKVAEYVAWQKTECEKEERRAASERSPAPGAEPATGGDSWLQSPAHRQ